jgi:hypothetical protein
MQPLKLSITLSDFMFCYGIDVMTPRCGQAVGAWEDSLSRYEARGAETPFRRACISMITVLQTG